MDFATISTIRGRTSGLLDERGCLCCNRAVFGPVDRIHSFCDRACFVAYWGGSYDWASAPAEVKAWCHTDLSVNEIRGQFCHAFDEEEDAFRRGGLEGYAELARWMPEFVRYA